VDDGEGLISRIIRATTHPEGEIPLTYHDSKQLAPTFACSQFIKRLEVNLTGTGCESSVTTVDEDGDGIFEPFTEINPGILVCWNVIAEQNNTVTPEREPLVFRSKLTVYADGSEVDARTIYFLVPADVTLPPVY
jgi:hypothetical protein